MSLCSEGESPLVERYICIALCGTVILLQTFSRVRWLFSILNKYLYIFIYTHTYTNMDVWLFVRVKYFYSLFVGHARQPSVPFPLCILCCRASELLSVGRLAACSFACSFTSWLTTWFACANIFISISSARQLQQGAAASTSAAKSIAKAPRCYLRDMVWCAAVQCTRVEASASDAIITPDTEQQHNRLAVRLQAIHWLPLKPRLYHPLKCGCSTQHCTNTAMHVGVTKNNIFSYADSRCNNNKIIMCI